MIKYQLIPVYRPRSRMISNLGCPAFDLVFDPENRTWRVGHRRIEVVCLILTSLDCLKFLDKGGATETEQEEVGKYTPKGPYISSSPILGFDTRG